MRGEAVNGTNMGIGGPSRYQSLGTKPLVDPSSACRQKVQANKNPRQVSFICHFRPV